MQAGGNIKGKYQGIVDERKKPRSRRGSISTSAARKPPLLQDRNKQDLAGMHPCYRAWILKYDLVRLWLARLPYEHTILSAFCRFNYQ